MSGSSGGNNRGNDTYNLDCEAVNFKTQLRSIPQGTIEQMKPKLRLPVVDNDGTVQAIHPDTGKFAGSIAYAKNVELIRCMSEGFGYVATVLKVDDGLVTVQVTPE
tara:strand:- start:16474 stop:16791 length:318 start_codon:yes stop_codon:yes gene_type:complete